MNRHVEYNRTVRYCERLEREGKAVILRPDHPIDSFEKDIDVLRETYQMGYDMAIERIEEIKKL